MLTTAALIAVLGLAGSSTAHMIMASPVPYGKSSLTNSPLVADGSDYPCKQRSGVYDAEGASNSMALGSEQPLSFTGSATHGGGSCQISITYDKNPTKDSVFKVIHSIEGGCPIQGVAGNNGDNANAADPSTYKFTIPDNLPTGDATLAWTWFNKIGNREMYMNCAPVTLTGGSSKRSTPRLAARDQAAFSALPDMFIANIPSSSCETVDSADLAFPDPGDSLDQLGTATAKPSSPTGASCGAAKAPAATGASSGSESGSNSGAGSSGSNSSAASPASSGSSQVTTPAAGSATAQPGVFVTASSGSGSSAPAASGGASSIAPAPSAGTGSTSTAGGLSGACTSEGMWNCIGGSSFQQCASGKWSPVQAMAAGTTCTSGQTMNFAIARS